MDDEEEFTRKDALYCEDCEEKITGNKWIIDNDGAIRCKHCQTVDITE